MQRLFQTSIFRIVLLYLLLLGATLTLVLGFVYWQTAGLLERQTDETVQAEIRGLAEQYRDEGPVRLMEVIHERSGPRGVAAPPEDGELDGAGLQRRHLRRRLLSRRAGARTAGHGHGQPEADGGD